MTEWLTPRIRGARFIFPFLALALVGGVVSCGDDDPAKIDSTQLIDDGDGDHVGPMQGTVVFVQMEGGFYGVAGDDGALWDPVNFPDTLSVDSLRVEFEGEPIERDSIHMWGQPFRLTNIYKIADPPPINLEPFREMARRAVCVDIRNRLFLINRQVIFWERESRCADWRYAYRLYGRTVVQKLCYFEDSIAGPASYCDNAGRYGSVFAWVVNNRDELDEGLHGAAEPIDF